MSVKTGEVLGVYSYRNQTINGNEPDYGKLTAVTDMYEPGSTFKIVTASACLEEGLENKGSVIQTNGGEYKIYNVTIKDSHKSSSLTFQQAVELSSNIGIVKSAEKLGTERFYKYARDFGFGISSGIDYPGEMKGLLKKPFEYTNVSLLFSAIGYEVLVNTVQLTNAYACIANYGVLMKPYIIKSKLTPDGILVFENKPTRLRTVVSESTAKTLTEFLCGVVERGTGTEARMDGIKIAGKTGTAQKLVKGEYSKMFYTSSFVGYFPASNPQIVISVIVDAPMAGQTFGGKVAAPVFKKMAERIIQLTGLNDENNILFEKVTGDLLVSNDLQQNVSQNEEELKLVNLDLEDVAVILTEKKLNFEVDGPVKHSVVRSYRKVMGEDGNIKLVILETADKNQQISMYIKGNHIIMPELNGMSLRNSIKLMSQLGLDFSIAGNGTVINQKPDAGSQITKNQRIFIVCQELKPE
jgi:cell division protein FtsI (penicillin-binding protein 3)